MEEPRDLSVSGGVRREGSEGSAELTWCHPDNSLISSMTAPRGAGGA